MMSSMDEQVDFMKRVSRWLMAYFVIGWAAMIAGAVLGPSAPAPWYRPWLLMVATLMLLVVPICLTAAIWFHGEVTNWKRYRGIDEDRV